MVVNVTPVDQAPIVPEQLARTATSYVVPAVRPVKRNGLVAANAALQVPLAILYLNSYEDAPDSVFQRMNADVGVRLSPTAGTVRPVGTPQLVTGAVVVKLVNAYALVSVALPQTVCTPH
jgi:hypothetical protein